MVTLYEKLNRKEMGVFLDALRSLKGSHIDPSATPPSHDPEDWTEIPAKISDKFPKQCIAVVQGGSLLLRNNFTREGFRVNILPRGKELRKERISTPEYGVDFDDDNLVLVCRVKYGEKIKEKTSISVNGPAVVRRVGIIKKVVWDPLANKYGNAFKDQESEWFLDQMTRTKISHASSVPVGKISGADLDLLSNIVGSIAWLVYLYEDGDHQGIVSYVERNFGELTKVIKRLQSAVKRYGVPPQVEKLVTYCLDFVDSL